MPSAVIFHGKTHIRTFTEREVPKLLAVVSEEARTRYEQAKAKKMPFVKRAAWVAKRGAAAYAAWYTYHNVVPLALLAFENNVVKASFWNRFKDRSKKHLAHPRGGDERANVAESMKVLRRAALARNRTPALRATAGYTHASVARPRRWWVCCSRSPLRSTAGLAQPDLPQTRCAAHSTHPCWCDLGIHRFSQASTRRACVRPAAPPRAVRA